jgi:hypothetical protein
VPLKAGERHWRSYEKKEWADWTSSDGSRGAERGHRLPDANLGTLKTREPTLLKAERADEKEFQIWEFQISNETNMQIPRLRSG